MAAGAACAGGGSSPGLRYQAGCRKLVDGVGDPISAAALETSRLWSASSGGGTAWSRAFGRVPLPGFIGAVARKRQET